MDGADGGVSFGTKEWDFWTGLLIGHRSGDGVRVAGWRIGDLGDRGGRRYGT